MNATLEADNSCQNVESLNQGIEDTPAPLSELNIDSRMQPIPSMKFTPLLHNSPYAQTTIEQAFLLKALNRLPKSHLEIEILQSILGYLNPIRNERLTIISNWNSHELERFIPYRKTNIFINLSEINTNCLEQVLLHSIETCEYIILTSNLLASRLLLNPDNVATLAQKVKGGFIFPHYFTNAPLFLEWGKTFSDHEQDDLHHWRWGLNHDVHTLHLTNNTMNMQSIELCFKLWMPSVESNSCLKVFFIEQCFKQIVKHDSHISLSLMIPPGTYRLSLICNNPITQSPNDCRNLHFAIADLAIKGDDPLLNLEKNEVYESKARFFSPHRDSTIRSILHTSGFFEVKAINQSTLNTSKTIYPASRFHVVNQYYFSHPTKPKEETEELGWYLAKRCPALSENTYD